MRNDAARCLSVCLSVVLLVFALRKVHTPLTSICCGLVVQHAAQQVVQQSNVKFSYCQLSNARYVAPIFDIYQDWLVLFYVFITVLLRFRSFMFRRSCQSSPGLSIHCPAHVKCLVDVSLLFGK